MLDDREGLVRSSPGIDGSGRTVRVTVLDQPLQDVDDEELTDVRLLLAIRERTRLDAATLARFPRLELLLQTGSHAYHVDASELARRRIPMALGRRAQAVRSAVPELTLLLMLACVRRIGEASQGARPGEWPALVGRTLAGRRVGRPRPRPPRPPRRRARRRPGHGGREPGTESGDREVRRDADGRPGPDGIVLLPLPRRCSTTSDVVSVHLRLSEESRGLLDGATGCSR